MEKYALEIKDTRKAEAMRARLETMKRQLHLTELVVHAQWVIIIGLVILVVLAEKL